MLDAQRAFPQIQERVLHWPKGKFRKLTTCFCWLECSVISAAEGESIAGRQEIRERVSVQFQPSKGEPGTRISCESLAPLFGFSVVIRGPRNIRSHTMLQTPWEIFIGGGYTKGCLWMQMKREWGHDSMGFIKSIAHAHRENMQPVASVKMCCIWQLMLKHGCWHWVAEGGLLGSPWFRNVGGSQFTIQEVSIGHGQNKDFYSSEAGVFK